MWSVGGVVRRWLERARVRAARLRPQVRKRAVGGGVVGSRGGFAEGRHRRFEPSALFGYGERAGDEDEARVGFEAIGLDDVRAGGVADVHVDAADGGVGRLARAKAREVEHVAQIHRARRETGRLEPASATSERLLAMELVPLLRAAERRATVVRVLAGVHRVAN